MAKQTFTTGQVLTAAQMTSLQQTAMGGGSTTAKTTSYVLVAADAGTTVAMNAAGSTTITVNTSLFAAGDSVFIQNWGAGTCTVTAGTATVTTHGSLALGQWEGGTLYFTSSSAAIFFDISQSTGMTNPMTTTGDTIYSSSGSTPARLGIGTTGQVLTVAGGVPSWATAGGSGFNFITRQSFSAVATANLDNVFTSTYETYQIVVEECFSSVGADDLRLRFRYAGPNTQSADYYNTLGQLKISSTYTSIDISGGTYANLLSRINSSTGQASNCTLWLNKVGSGSRNPIGYSIGHIGNALYSNVSDVYQLTAREYTGIQLYASSGNLTATVAIYGLAKS